MRRRSLLCWLVLAASSCASHSTPVLSPPGSGGPGSPPGAIGDYLATLHDLPLDPVQMKAGPTGTPTPEGDYLCTSQDLEETRQYDQIVALAANSDSLWPGAIIAGDSVYSGLFTQLVFDRAPLTISTSLGNLDGTKKAVMQQPTLSAFRDAIGQVLRANVTGATPANLYSEIDEVYSDKELSLALGANASWTGAVKIGASFDFSQKAVLSHYLVKYTQSYYTVDVDQPSQPSDFFTANVTLDQIKAKSGVDNPPVYVSSITYGRTIVFTFESKYSSTEMGAALDFVYKGGVDAGGNTSVKYQDIISSSKITAYILGGAGDQAAMAIDSYDSLIKLIKQGGNYSPASPGAPIAYKLAYLKNNAPARLSFTSDYSVKSCSRVSQQVKVTLVSIAVQASDTDKSRSLYGTLTVSTDGTSIDLFNRDKNSAAVITRGQSWPTSGVVSEQILQVTPQPGSVIHFEANIWNHNSLLPDDNLGNDSVDAPFELGWNRDIPLYLTGDGAQVVVTFHLEPIN